jgi:hypothetical protein
MTDAVQFSAEHPSSGTSREGIAIGSLVTNGNAYHLPALANHTTERLYQNVPASKYFCLRSTSCRYHYYDCYFGTPSVPSFGCLHVDDLSSHFVMRLMTYDQDDLDDVSQLL